MIAYLIALVNDSRRVSEKTFDLCVIIPSEVKDPFEVAYQVRIETRKLIRIPLDVIVIKAEDFESRKSLHGTLENTIATEGIAV